MVRILTIGDPHFKLDNLQEMEFVTEAIYKLCDSNSFDFIVVLGDVLNNNSRINVHELCAANNFIQKLADRAETFVLIGNHDRINNSDFLSNIHPFTAFGNNRRITIVDKVVRRNIQGCDFVFVPYVPPGKFIEALETININDTILKDGSITAVFAHQEFKGCKLGAKRSVAGDIWKKEYPLVISGHIHEYEKLADNLIYTGTAHIVAFGATDKKTVSIFEFENTITNTDISGTSNINMLTNTDTDTNIQSNINMLTNTDISGTSNINMLTNTDISETSNINTITNTDISETSNINMLTKTDISETSNINMLTNTDCISDISSSLEDNLPHIKKLSYIEERIELDIPKKKVFKITSSEFFKRRDFLKIDEKTACFIKVIVTGSADELKLVQQNYIYTHLKKYKVNIALKSINTESKKITVTKTSLGIRERLNNKLQEFEDLATFRDLIGI